MSETNTETNTESNTVKLHRVFTAPPERVFKAFIDPDALVKWMAPHGFTAKVHHLDAKVGGTYKMSFSNFSTGSSHSFGGSYHEIIPNQLLRYTDQFDDPNLPGTIEVIIQLKAVSVGTEVHITQSGIPDVIPVEACYLGWQESLQLLALLVNAEIPDQ
ncbi:toxin [Acinetobacter sp. ANC 4169]|uniref:SRPBCC family protein n=1 Tax=Acinetobacter sp. ANC 4169 TaxID=1977879 RepID=UPI000A349F46|nr:SRPBCC family protein [Acinetobacter sp. ANC 4169]OTG75120.1 toxin [Acinetobacter sp. ANC 4169]